MTEQEILEKLKEALDYKYMYDSWDWSDERKEVDNLEDYQPVLVTSIAEQFTAVSHPCPEIYTNNPKYSIL